METRHDIEHTTERLTKGLRCPWKWGHCESPIGRQFCPKGMTNWYWGKNGRGQRLRDKSAAPEAYEDGGSWKEIDQLYNRGARRKRGRSDQTRIGERSRGSEDWEVQTSEWRYPGQKAKPALAWRQAAAVQGRTLPRQQHESSKVVVYGHLLSTHWKPCRS